MRRALAIQLIINREWGLAMNENPLQGSFIIDELTDLVEEAVLAEFDRDHRARRRARRDGDRLPARPHPGRVDALRARASTTARCRSSASTPSCDPRRRRRAAATIELARGDRGGEAVAARPARATSRPAHAREAAGRARRGSRTVATGGGNVFDVLMDAARVCSLGQITEAFFEVGGQYRRNV